MREIVLTHISYFLLHASMTFSISLSIFFVFSQPSKPNSRTNTFSNHGGSSMPPNGINTARKIIIFPLFKEKSSEPLLSSLNDGRINKDKGETAISLFLSTFVAKLLI